MIIIFFLKKVEISKSRPRSGFVGVGLVDIGDYFIGMAELCGWEPGGFFIGAFIP